MVTVVERLWKPLTINHYTMIVWEFERTKRGNLVTWMNDIVYSKWEYMYKYVFSYFTIYFHIAELAKKIEYAVDTCFYDPDGLECTIAWMEVDEISSALYNLMEQRHTIQDFVCDDDPSHRECREYDL
jgi:hypothetical protein